MLSDDNRVCLAKEGKIDYRNGATTVYVSMILYQGDVYRLYTGLGQGSGHGWMEYELRLIYNNLVDALDVSDEEKNKRYVGNRASYDLMDKLNKDFPGHGYSYAVNFNAKLYDEMQEWFMIDDGRRGDLYFQIARKIYCGEALRLYHPLRYAIDYEPIGEVLPYPEARQQERRYTAMISHPNMPKSIMKEYVLPAASAGLNACNSALMNGVRDLLMEAKSLMGEGL